MSIPLSDKDIRQYQNQLWQLLEDITYRYTMGDSTSLPVETANELLKSALFCIGVYLESSRQSLGSFAPLQTGIVAELFSRGRHLVLHDIERGKSLLKAVIDTSLPIHQQSYRDTLQAIVNFFKQYDAYFMAHEIPCSIDYPLCHPVEERYGIAYMLTYLKRLYLENAFCARFPPNLVRRLLACHWPDYQRALVNMCDPVFINAMGLCLLDKDVYSLNISAPDKAALANLFDGYSDEEAKSRVVHSMHTLLQTLAIEEAFAYEYFLRSAHDLFIRISALKNTDGFYNLFVTLME